MLTAIKSSTWLALAGLAVSGCGDDGQSSAAVTSGSATSKANTSAKTSDPLARQAVVCSGLDRDDLLELINPAMQSLESWPPARWGTEADPGIVVVTIQPDPGEASGELLAAVNDDMEAALKHNSSIRVVTAEQEPELVAQLRSDQYPGDAAALDEQFGVQYYLTGQLFRMGAPDESCATYLLFLRVVEYATGDLLWQVKRELRKTD